MGRNAGWIALYSGLAGGADVILIPEIPFRHEHIAEAVEERDRTNRFHTIVVAAEGAMLADRATALGQDAGADREARLGGIGLEVAAEIERRTGKETRSVVLGHLQRGGSPTHFDRVLCTLLGARAVEMIADGAFGRLVTYTGHAVDSVPLAMAVDRIRTVDPGGALIRAAREMGVSFGDAPAP
jgi:6-phosphofructokinase 1